MRNLVRNISGQLALLMRLLRAMQRRVRHSELLILGHPLDRLPLLQRNSPSPVLERLP